jgi:hypothetical protein
MNMLKNRQGPKQSIYCIGSTFEKDIIELDPREACKYLGIEESHFIEYKNEKEKLKKEYLRRLGIVLDTQLSAKNKIQAVGSLAVPLLLYGFGIVNRRPEKFQKLDRKMRKLLTIHGQHHPKAETDRLYIPRKQEGKDLMQSEEAYEAKIKKETVEICRQQVRSTNIDCRSAATQHQLRSVIDS